MRGKFFAQRVVGVCNTLPGVVVEAGTIEAFKGLLDKHMNMQGIEGYGARTGRRDEFNLASCSAQHGGPKGLFLCYTVLCSIEHLYR